MTNNDAVRRALISAGKPLSMVELKAAVSIDAEACQFALYDLCKRKEVRRIHVTEKGCKFRYEYADHSKAPKTFAPTAPGDETIAARLEGARDRARVTSATITRAPVSRRASTTFRDEQAAAVEAGQKLLERAVASATGSAPMSIEAAVRTIVQLGNATGLRVRISLESIATES